MSVAYNYDDNGYYNGISTCQPNPLEEGAFLVPGQSTMESPGDTPTDGHVHQWNGSAWAVVVDPLLSEKQWLANIGKTIVIYKDISGEEKIILETVEWEIRQNRDLLDMAVTDFDGLSVDDNPNKNYSIIDGPAPSDAMAEGVFSSRLTVWDTETQTVVPRIQALVDLDESESAWFNLRLNRNSRLVETDYTQMTDAALTQDSISAFAAYRTLLRDLPGTISNPITWLDNPIWPVEPT